MGPLGTNIEELRVDYESVTGKPFRYFYCPILHVDEDVTLTKGHVVSESLGGKARVLQREDVDQGFGSFFEAEAADAIRHGLDDSPLDLALKGDPVEMKQLARRFSFRLLFEGTEKALDASFRKKGEKGGFYVSTDELKDALGKDAERRTFRGALGVELDARSSILVTSLRTSHLAWFRHCGYRYVFSNEGRFLASVLESIYGKFIGPRRGPNRSKKGSLIAERVKREVDEYCFQFANLIRPVPPAALETLSVALQKGSPDTGRFLALWDGNQIYGKVSVVRLGNQRVGVATPVITDARGWALIGVEANLDLVLSEGWFDAAAGFFRVDPPERRAIWPGTNAATQALPTLTIRQAAQLVIDS